MTRSLLCVIILTLFIGCSSYKSDNLNTTTLSSPHIKFTKSLNSWKDILRSKISMQKFDYSCGAASLSTILKYYYNDEVAENEIILDILENLGKEELNRRKKLGFSILDLKEYVIRRGYRAIGIKLKIEQLKLLKAPVIGYVETSEYNHFLVIRGVVEDRVFLSDPSKGNIRMSINKFTKEWDGTILVLDKESFELPENNLLVTEKPGFRNETFSARQFIYR